MQRVALCICFLLQPHFYHGDQVHLATFFSHGLSSTVLPSFSRSLLLGSGRLFPIRAIPLPICTNKDGKELLPKIV